MNKADSGLMTVGCVEMPHQEGICHFSASAAIGGST